MKIILALALILFPICDSRAAAPPAAEEVADGPRFDLPAAAAAAAATPAPTPTGPEPAPWWMRVEEAQALAIKWLGALTVVAGALFAFVMFVIGKMNEIKARVEHQANRSDTQQKQINEIALNVIPPTDQPK